MKLLVLASTLLLLAACGKPAPGTSTPVPAASTTAAAEAGTADTVANDQPDDVVPPMSAEQMSAASLDAAIAGDWRTPADVARDKYRHPRATLTFFGIRPDMTVIEITPGGGWYAELLAPLLKDNGSYIAALTSSISGDEAARDAKALRAKFAADPAHYGKARVIEFDPRTPNLGAPGSADMVLTFRNVHNWVAAGTAPAMFKAFFDVLAPGGVLGVTDHRAAAGASLDAVKGTGYLPEAYVVKLATDAGFTLDAKSEVNANPMDTKDYPKGVWTLPPTLTLGDKDKAKYLAIGESDRMTLRFVKPDRPAAAGSASGP
ncbi:MAG TPA: methyltransferase [Rhodanobacteraceae bacterium]|nr:methyltransferase [Rhodanobacteraceae bacterium]